MFDDTSIYRIHRELIGGLSYYFVSFFDENGNSHKTHITRPVYLELCRFVKRERNLRRFSERHIEHSELTDEDIYHRAAYHPKSMEDVIADNDMKCQLHKAIFKLPETQRSRLLRYYFGKMTYEQIAKEDGCTKRAVKFSVDIAVDTIKTFFKKF